VVAAFAGFEFKTCPVAQYGEREEYVAGLARMGTLRRTLPLEVVKLPGKLYHGLLYCEALLREAEDDDRT